MAAGKTSTTYPSLFLAAILVAFVFLKALYNPYPVTEFGPDAGLYYQIARHVIQGDGLLTSVSRAHQGISQLPFPTADYPLWPLALGGAGRLFGLDIATVWLPEVLFVVSLFLLYHLANSIARCLGSPFLLSLGGRGLIDVGHLSILLFGVNARYFKYTSLPFTEGLAFCLLFGTLLALSRVVGPRPLLWGALAGGLAALGYLTRYQFIGLILAVPGTLVVAATKQPKYRRAAALAAICAVLPAVLWIVHVGTAYGQFTPMMLIDGAALRQTPELEPYSWIIKTGSIGEFVSDRLWGTVYVAFNPSNSFSYVKSFGYVVYLVPLSLLFLALQPRLLVKAAKSPLRPDSMVVVGTIAAGLMLIAPVHATHANRFGSWFFQFRQGLPFVLLLVVSLCFFLTRRSLVVRLATLMVIALSLWQSAMVFESWFHKGRDYPAPAVARQEFARWLEARPTRPVFATTQAYVLGAQTQGVFHHVSCSESRAQMCAYFRHVGVTYLVTVERDKTCRFFTGIRDDLDLVAAFGEGDTLLRVWSPRQTICVEDPAFPSYPPQEPDLGSSVCSAVLSLGSRASPLRTRAAAAPSRTAWR